MILRDRLNDSRALIGAGQLCLVLGLVGQRFIHPSSDFWAGFISGLTGVLIGVSIVLNVRGLVLARRSRSVG